MIHPLTQLLIAASNEKAAGLCLPGGQSITIAANDQS
jgi:hypothetical protein